MIILHFLEKAKALSWDFLSMTQFKRQMTLHRNCCRAEEAHFWSLDQGCWCFFVNQHSSLWFPPWTFFFQIRWQMQDRLKLFLLCSFSAACCM